MNKVLLYLLLIVFFHSCYDAQRSFLDRITFLRFLQEVLFSDVTFSFAYPQTYFEFTKGLPIQKISPNSNQKIASCTSKPSLPSGISLQSNCEIVGTPTDEKPFQNYLIQAVSETGKTASFGIGIVVTTTPPSNLQYPTNSLTFTVGVSIPNQTPTYVGTITSCSSSPPLPAGLNLSSNCEITGTPTTTQSMIQYTITGSNPYGQTSTTIQISITADPPSGLSYAGSPFVFSLGIMISPQTPTLVGVATTCTASPPLPTGLSLDPANCTLSGSPTSLQSFTVHTITATNPYGSTSTTIGVTVSHVPPHSLAYPSGSYSLYENLAIAPITPSFVGTITNCVATPPLPTGLVLNTTNCEITGTPTILQSATTYTITGSNTGGSTSTSLSIAIVIAPPSALTFTPSTYTLTQGLSISPITPSYVGTITNCVATPPLPTGLILNTSSCQITGTPTVLQSATNHTITASNSSGSTTASITITVNIAPPSGLTFTPTTYTFIKDTAITPITPIFSGTVTSCTASPSLPTGLLINNTTCVISGTPTVLQASTSYTITASNTSGSTTASISIAVELLPPSGLSYSGSPFTFFKDVGISTITPSVSGTVTSCSSSPALPVGLSLHPTTCAISGTPTAIQTLTSYTITASNPYGSTTATIQIQVMNKGIVYMAIYNSTLNRAKRYNNAGTLSGSTLTDMGTTGHSFAIAIDKTRNILYIAESLCTTQKIIQVFDNADTNSGATPSRTFTYFNMICPAALAVDESNDRLYIATNATTSSTSTNRKIFRLNNASTASGILTLGANFREINVSAFDASVSGIRRATLWGDSLYVCDYGQDKIFVFDNISGYANGANATPNRTIDAGDGPAGVAIDITNNLLFVSLYLENKIKVFANANTVSGTPTPIRTISSTSLNGPVGIFYFAPLNRLYVGSFSNGTLMYFENANTLDGSIAPAATLTGITSISDVQLDFTR